MLQPCTTRDFMNYLIYIEHAAENLQFYLWYRDYQKRFMNLPDKEKGLSPFWTREKADTEANQTVQKQQVSVETAAVFKGTDFAPGITSVHEIKRNPFGTPPATPAADGDSVYMSEPAWSDHGSTLNGSYGTQKSHQQISAAAFEDANVKVQPCK